MRKILCLLAFALPMGAWAYADCNTSAECFRIGANMVRQQHNELGAFPYMEKACNLGSGIGCALTSALLLAGDNGIKQNVPKAIDLSLRGCRLGEPQACKLTAKIKRVVDESCRRGETTLCRLRQKFENQ